MNWLWTTFRKGKTPFASAIFLLVATALYLLIELAFNARLLDVAGRPGEVDPLLGIEQWGRLISGFAVALAFWGFIAKAADKEGWELAETLTWGALWTLIIVVGVYWMEKAIIDGRVEKTPPQTRQLGAIGVLVTRYLHDGGALEGIPVDGAFLATPEGKAFYALFADNYSAVLKNSGGSEPVIAAVIDKNVRSKLGGADGTYETLFLPAIERVREIYNRDYISGVNRLVDVLERAPSTADDAWTTYEGKLARYNWTPTTVPDQRFDAVRREVKTQMDVNVPSDWLPWDRLTFQTLVLQKVSREAHATWSRTANEIMPGANLPYTLQTFEDFIRFKPVQDRLRNELTAEIETKAGAAFRLGEFKKPLGDDWTAEDWNTLIYEPAVTHAVTEQINLVVRDTKSFAPGGAKFCDGVDAVYALKVPAFALFISILGAVYHSSKVIWYLFYLIPGAYAGIRDGSRLIAAIRWLVRGAFVAALIALPALQTSNTLSAAKYSTLLEHKEIADGRRSALTNDWIIRAQQLYYPLNDGVRNTVLLGAPFSKLPFLPAHQCADENGRSAANATARNAASGAEVETAMKAGALQAAQTERVQAPAQHSSQRQS